MKWHYESCPACNGVGMAKATIMGGTANTTPQQTIHSSCEVCDGNGSVKVPDGYALVKAWEPPSCEAHTITAKPFKGTVYS